MPTPVAPYPTRRAHSSASWSGLAMCVIRRMPCASTPSSRRKPRWRSATLASVQCVAMRTRSTSYARAFLMSWVVAQPGNMRTPSLLVVRVSRAIDIISSSLSRARPTWRDEAASPLPWPTSTTGTAAASAAFR